MTQEIGEDLANDIMLTLGFALCVLGFFMHYWYWSFIGVLFFLSGCGVFRPDHEKGHVEGMNQRV